MLDFGAKMPENNTAPEEEQDDLFTAARKNMPEVLNSNAAEVPAAAPQVPAVQESAPEHNVQTVPMPGAPRIHRRKNAGAELDEKLEVSRFLKSAREKCGMTRNDVAEITRIRGNFLSALENGNYDELPQTVFVLAYLRRLCETYGISAEDEEFVIKPWQDIQCEIPENLPASVYADDDNENRRLIKKLEIGIFTGGAIIIAGLIVFGIIMLVSSFSRSKRPEPAFDESKLLEIQPRPVPTAPAAATPRSSGTRRSSR